MVKGNSHNLLKAGAKRRRTKAEIQEEKDKEAERLRDIAYKMEHIGEVERRVQ